MTVLFANTAEGGTNGTTATPTNSGGASGDAFTSTLGTIAPVFDNTQTMHGALAYSFAYTASTFGCMVWNVSAPSLARVVARFYVYVPANPSANDYLLAVRGGSGQQIANIRLTSAGVFQVQDGTSTLIAASAYAGFPLAQWVRVELEVKPGTTTSNGTLGYQLFLGDSTTALTSWTSSAVNAGTVDVGQVWVGRLTSSTAVTTRYYDDIETDTLTSGFIGPSVVPAKTGAAAGTVAFTGAAAGSRPAKGAGAGAFTFTGSAVGQAPRKGSGAGTVTFTAAASGVAPVVGVHSGSGSGLFTFTGTASGATQRTGSAAGTYTFTGAAHGSSANAADVTVTASLDPRPWASALTTRTNTGLLVQRSWEARLE